VEKAFSLPRGGKGKRLTFLSKARIEKKRKLILTHFSQNGRGKKRLIAQRGGGEGEGEKHSILFDQEGGKRNADLPFFEQGTREKGGWNHKGRGMILL